MHVSTRCIEHARGAVFGAVAVKLVGIDAPTVENMELCDGEVHATLLRAGIPLLEGLRLEEADKENYMLSALPIRLTGENGAPCRAVLVEEN